MLGLSTSFAGCGCVAHFDIVISCTQWTNITADHLSRSNLLQAAFQTISMLYKSLTPLPHPVF